MSWHCTPRNTNPGEHGAETAGLHGSSAPSRQNLPPALAAGTKGAGADTDHPTAFQWPQSGELLGGLGKPAAITLAVHCSSCSYCKIQGRYYQENPFFRPQENIDV